LIKTLLTIKQPQITRGTAIRKNAALLLVAVVLCIIIVVISAVLVASNSPSDSMDDSFKIIGEPNITVPDDYLNITSAVSNAKNGDVILVKSGVYIESVTINKTLTLKGENKETTIVNGNNLGPTFLLLGENIKITGFEVRNAEGSVKSNGPAAIHLLWAHQCYVFDNIVVNCGKGIWIYGGSDNHVSDNIALGNYYGVRLGTTNHNVIINNTAQDGWSGIFLENSVNNTLKNNNMRSNKYNFGVHEETSATQNQIDTSNRVEGKKVYCLTGLSNQIISPQTYPDLGTLILADSQNITIQGLCIEDVHCGVRLFRIEDPRIENVTVQGAQFGFYLVHCSNSRLLGNRVK
jgi:parallel beta-helix repeat protein